VNANIPNAHIAGDVESRELRTSKPARRIALASFVLFRGVFAKNAAFLT
jgi:hypothetical protein